jgi:tRNA (cytidine/uridine-2'-O-)-methyltransferase
LDSKVGSTVASGTSLIDSRARSYSGRLEPESPLHGKDFRLSIRQLRRAGLDYWDEVNVRLWNSFEELHTTQSPNARYFFLTTKSKRAYYDEKFHRDDFLVFGRETKGLPEALLAANVNNCSTIPMHGTRSLNLATAVAVVLFEAVRQQQR